VFVCPFLAGLLVTFWSGALAADEPPQDAPIPPEAARRIADLEHEDVQLRRGAARAILDADRDVRLAALPAMIDALREEEDGQVRLAVLDTLIEMGQDAEPAVSALVETLETDYGGRYREEVHQDYRSAVALSRIGPPAAEGLRGLLSEDKENIRAVSAMALGRIGPEAAPAVPELIGLLIDEEDEVRREASLALARIGAAAHQPLMIALEIETDSSLRASAAEALAQTVEPTDEVRDRLLELALNDDPDPDVRAAALAGPVILELSDAALERILDANLRRAEEPVRVAAVNILAQRERLLRDLAPTLEQLLLAEEDGVAWHAAFLLHLLGPEAAPRLIDALRHEKSRIDRIAEALALIGPPIAEPLGRALEDPHPRVRQGAALALSRVRPLAPGTTERLSRGLDDPDADVRAAFLKAIGQLGPSGSGAVPAVRAQLDAPRPAIRLQALESLVQIAPRDSRLLEDLIRRLDDPEADIQLGAIARLSAFGSSSRAALPTVITKLESPHAKIQLAAAEWIGGQGLAAEEAVPALIALLDEDAPELRAAGARTLGAIGPAAQPAFEALAARLDDAAPTVREAATLALASLERDASELRPHIAATLEDPEPDVRRAGRRAIFRLGRDGAIFLPDLIRLTADEEEGSSVERTLRRFERLGTAEASIPELRDLLKHDSDTVRLHTLRFLALAGPAADPALPDIEPLLDDLNPEIRVQAEAAFAAITEEPEPETDPSGP